MEVSSLSYDQTLALTTLVYNSHLDAAIPGEGSISIRYLVDDLAQRGNHELAAKMTDAEWQSLFDFIREDETLMRLEIDRNTFVDFTASTGRQSGHSAPSPGFRAMVVTDPQGQYNNTAILRGTAGTADQWHDNFSPMSGAVISPHQTTAREYILGLGMTNLDVAGHSKGGNLAEFAAWNLPPGIINRALSYNGQNMSPATMEALTPEQKLHGAGRTISINERRDVVPRLFSQRGDAFYFITDFSGDTPVKNASFFSYHKPNLFMYRDMSIGQNGFESVNPITVNPRSSTFLGGVTRIAANLISEDSDGRWGDNYYLAVRRSGQIYLDLMSSRMHRLSILNTHLSRQFGAEFDTMIEKYDSPDSRVVDGAIIFCDYGDVLGELRLPACHGELVKGKSTIVETDTCPAENVIFEGGKCFGLSWRNLSETALRMDGRGTPGTARLTGRTLILESNLIGRAGLGLRNRVSSITRTDAGRNIGGAAADVAVSVGTELVRGGTAIGGAIVEAGRDVGGAIVDAGRTVGGAIGDAGRVVGEAAADAGRAIGGAAADAGRAIADGFSGAGRAIGNAFANTFGR